MYYPDVKCIFCTSVSMI